MHCAAAGTCRRTMWGRTLLAKLPVAASNDNPNPFARVPRRADGRTPRNCRCANLLSYIRGRP